MGVGHMTASTLKRATAFGERSMALEAANYSLVYGGCPECQGQPCKHTRKVSNQAAYLGLPPAPRAYVSTRRASRQRRVAQ
eukprot:g44267.t1